MEVKASMLKEEAYWEEEAYPQEVEPSREAFMFVVKDVMVDTFLEGNIGVTY